LSSSTQTSTTPLSTNISNSPVTSTGGFRSTFPDQTLTASPSFHRPTSTTPSKSETSEYNFKHYDTLVFINWSYRGFH
jgi:hypothetical protein